MHRIVLTEVPEFLSLQIQGNPICVHHKRSRPVQGMRAVLFDRFKQDPRGSLSGVDSLVFVGLSDAMTPGNRTEMVWEVLFNKTPEIPKWSVDRFLFRAEPWRAWFHFGLVNAPYRGYTYSYLAESHYNAWLDGVSEENPFSLDEVVRWGGGAVLALRVPRVRLDVQIHKVPDAVHAEYALEKAAAFDEERTAKGVLRRLGRFASNVLPARSVPQAHRVFAAKGNGVVATDLPIDRWLVGELKRLVDLANGIGDAFRG